MNTSWIDLIFVVNTKSAKSAEAIASRCTKLGIFIEDYSDMERMLPLIGRADYIDENLKAKDRSHVAIHIYVPSDENPEYVFTQMSNQLKKASIDFSFKHESFDENDWANDWKKHHTAQRAGKRLVICPSWEEYERADEDLIITIDPGSSFGTGKDETTRVCLQLIETSVSDGDRILDMGCGSGVLSIAGLLLGAGSAVGVDIDKNAVNAAIENASINGVASRFDCLCGNVLTDSKFEEELGCGYDLICANIVADVHISMKKIYFSKLNKDGKLLLSGIIDNRADDVRSAFESEGFTFVSAAEENGWLALGFKKV